MTDHKTLTIVIALLVLALAGLACSVPSPAPAVVPTATALQAATVLPAATQPPAPTTAAPTAVLTSTAPAATASPTATLAFSATIQSPANVRGGPGAGYPILGTLAAGLKVQVVGRTTDKVWWQIDFPLSPDGKAWVTAANLAAPDGAQVETLPIVSAPAVPTRVPGTPLPAAPPPVVAGGDVLKVDKPQLTPGECTNLRWDVRNAQSLIFDNGAEKVPVPPQDVRSVCLDETTTFTLQVTAANGTVTRYAVTITVSEDCSGKQTQIARLDVSSTTIKKGETATISWDVTCAKGVYFQVGKGPRQKMLRHDSAEVDPARTETYHLIVIALDGSEIRRDITIEVTQ